MYEVPHAACRTGEGGVHMRRATGQPAWLCTCPPACSHVGRHKDTPEPQNQA